MKLTPPPIKVLAQSLGLPVLQPTKVRTPEFAAELRATNSDLAVVVAYGRILTVPVLEAPRLGCVNVHGSLLPKYRGAAPIQWAIVCGETVTGVSLMQMDAGMDTGPELARASLAIGPDETAGELALRLSQLGAALLRRELPRFWAGELRAVPQPEGATLAPLLRKEDGELDWSEPAARIHDRVRGLTPWPGAQTTLAGARVKVHRTRLLAALGESSEPGRVLEADPHGIVVACGQGRLAITELQFDGGKRMSASAALAGRRLPDGARFAKAGA
jgi:methionyl-tRNA formyltransferase